MQKKRKRKRQRGKTTLSSALSTIVYAGETTSLHLRLTQLGEILDGTDHLAGVGVLVVVPGDNLAPDKYASFGILVTMVWVAVEQRTVGDADDVGGDDLSPSL